MKDTNLNELIFSIVFQKTDKTDLSFPQNTPGTKITIILQLPLYTPNTGLLSSLFFFFVEIKHMDGDVLPIMRLFYALLAKNV
jgi:hypothetical protein